MLCNSMLDLSSIHVKSDDGDSKNLTEVKSNGSLPSLRESVLGGGSPIANGQPLTMKQIDAKLKAFERENFDLKLRLYYENRKKGSRKVTFDDVYQKENKPMADNFKKILIEKDNEISNLRSQLAELENKKEFEVGILRREKEAYANDLEASQAICRQFMEHLTEVKEFWRKFLMETSTNSNKSLLESLSNWLNSSQDILDKSSILLYEERIDKSIREAEEIAANFASMKYKSKESEFKKPNDMKGMSSLGLLSDLSQFVTKEPITWPPAATKIDNETQTEIVSSEITALIQSAVMLASRRYADGIAQTEATHAVEVDCQTEPSLTFERSSQTGNGHKLIKQGIDVGFQTNLSSGVSKSVQTIVNKIKDSSVQTEKRKTKKVVKPRSSTVIIHDTKSPDLASKDKTTNTDTCGSSKHEKITNNEIEKERSGQPVITPSRGLSTFKTILSPITESPKLSQYSPLAVLEKATPTSTDDLTYSLGKLTIDKSSETPTSREKNVQTSEQQHLINEIMSNKEKEMSQAISQIIRREKCALVASQTANRKPQRAVNKVKISDYALNEKSIHPKELHTKEYDEQHLLVATTKHKPQSLSDGSDGLDSGECAVDSGNDSGERSIQVYLTYKHYQILRGHLNQLTVHLSELETLKDHLILEIIDKSEYSTAINPCLANIRHTINSCRIIFHHFTIVDENSVLVQFERIKAKKENIEKAITQQMKKADKLLKKAKINLRV